MNSYINDAIETKLQQDEKLAEKLAIEMQNLREEK